MWSLDFGDGDLLWTGSSLVFPPLQLAPGLGSRRFLKGARNDRRNERCCGSFLVNSLLSEDRHPPKEEEPHSESPGCMGVWSLELELNKSDPHYGGGSDGSGPRQMDSHNFSGTLLFYWWSGKCKNQEGLKGSVSATGGGHVPFQQRTAEASGEMRNLSSKTNWGNLQLPAASVAFPCCCSLQC